VLQLKYTHFPNMFFVILHAALALMLVYYRGCAKTQVVSRRPLTVETRVRAEISPVGFVVGRMSLEQFFPEFLGFPLSISFYHGFPYSCIIWVMNNRSVVGRSSETLFSLH
jgi:hypothetical protein